MNKLYGWYSLNAYNEGKTEYIYTNVFGQETFCTIISNEKDCPYKEEKYGDAIYSGEVIYFIKEQKKIFER
tara:strand:+ start:237 stop:449 length:213 start_codon:yes stop_codon:yes gene_type:complete